MLIYISGPLCICAALFCSVLCAVKSLVPLDPDFDMWKMRLTCQWKAVLDELCKNPDVAPCFHSHLASVSPDGTVQLWHTFTLLTGPLCNELVLCQNTGHKSNVTGLALLLTWCLTL